MSEALVTLIATPELEEALVDWLLDRDYRGFTSFECSGHGIASGLLSTAEQVAGRQRQVGFWVVLPRDEATRLVERLGAELGGAELHYWIAPLLASGPVGAPDAAD